MANTNITRTCTAGNRRKWTWSAWIKRTATGTEENLFTGYESSTTYTELKFNASDELQFQNRISNTWSGELKTNRKFKDVNAWYHIVIVWDSENTNSAAQRMRMYINGVEESSFATRQNPSNPTDSSVNWVSRPLIYGSWGQNSRYFNGLMSHVNFVDGTVYTPSEFGSTDSTTGEWKIKTDVSVTYGTNGSFILKDGNSLTDQSGEGNNFTAGTGTLTDTKDCPSNVLTTMNSLANTVASVGLEAGNNTVSMTNSKGGILSTLACTGGKYYAEMEIAAMPQDSRFHIGILPKPVVEADDPISTNNKGIMLSGYNAAIYANSGSGSAILNDFYGNATGRFSGAPILGCAVDLESATKTMAISINGAWVTGSNTTDASFSNALKVDISTPVALEDDWFFGCGSGNGSGTTGVYNWNFGNGYFSTTAVTSAGTAGSTPGTFEYDVPSGYEPLSTRGLNA